MSIKKCYGNEYRYIHARCCRPGRPSCKRARAQAGQTTCECPGYGFIHRLGSGNCYYGKSAQQKACA